LDEACYFTYHEIEDFLDQTDREMRRSPVPAALFQNTVGRSPAEHSTMRTEPSESHCAEKESLQDGALGQDSEEEQSEYKGVWHFVPGYGHCWGQRTTRNGYLIKELLAGMASEFRFPVFCPLSFTC
jgi:hypothetical protein